MLTRTAFHNLLHPQFGQDTVFPSPITKWDRQNNDIHPWSTSILVIGTLPRMVLRTIECNRDEIAGLYDKSNDYSKYYANSIRKDNMLPV